MMNGRHLPAGQGMPPDAGRRRAYNQNPQYPPVQQFNPNPYLNPYNPPFYPQQQYIPQYHNPGIPPQYVQYPPYVRSPPPMHHYGPPHIPQQPPLPQQHYPRPHQSPAMQNPYQAPPPPQTPTSTHSSHTVPVPSTPPTPQTALSAAPTSPSPGKPSQEPFRAPLPWLSHPDLTWPTRRARRKRKPATRLFDDPVQLPDIPAVAAADVEDSATTAPVAPRPETPTSHPPSEEAPSTNPTTPSSAQIPTLPVQGDTTPVPQKALQRHTAPAVPVLPAVPKPVTRESVKPVSEKTEETVSDAAEPGGDDGSTEPPAEGAENTSEDPAPAPAPAPKAWAQPKQWSGLFQPTARVAPKTTIETGGSSVPTFGQTNSESLAEALTGFKANSKDAKVTFLKPRGLVNTGNMCYMNSVLQVLTFCAPFYNFLDQVSKKAVHTFKSDTPLIDSMIMFMREFPVIDSATSVEQLRLRLKDGELEQYGDPFTPDFVYEVINRLPRFSTMRRGHQQDAEEFLGFLLEGLHDECVRVMKATSSNHTSAFATPTNDPSSPTSDAASVNGRDDPTWLEVGRKQKASVTRSSGKSEDSPVFKIFGGQLRSELRVPGLKDSVTLEPYQPLQLDIGAHNVNNIVDALKALTRSETLHGDFKSPKGPNVTAIKQVFIEDSPQVLILHLKRFQYDNTGGTQKIWKKVGYPLELELPKEVFARAKRNQMGPNDLPKYRLTAVVYHHGKNASGGHYTVDVRRQDGREWIRLDDTVIRRVKSEDVAAAGTEEDLKVLAAAADAQKKDSSSTNPFAVIDDEEKEEDNDGWKQASGPGKKWSSIVNGAQAPKGKSEKFSIKDNKVAYLLFYQRV